MKKNLALLIQLLLIVSCNNLEDADLSSRKTFIKLFNAPHSFTAAAFEITPGGFALLGNMVVNDTLTVMTIIETDFNGNRIGENHYFHELTGKSFKPLLNSGTLQGYVVVADSIKIDPLIEQAANTEIISLKLLKISNTFQITDDYTLTDREPISANNHPIKIDYIGRSLTLTDDGRIFVLAGKKEGVAAQQTSPENTYLNEFNSSLDSVWAIKYGINDKTYQNSKSLIYENNPELEHQLIWASAIASQQGSFNTSYVVVPAVPERSTFVNFDHFGQTSIQSFIPKDIVKTNSGSGYGIVGTYSSETNGSRGNLFFLQTNKQGTINESSIRYFDGESGVTPLTDPTLSAVLDGGEAITSTTDDGFIVAGTTRAVAENSTDIWLMKLDPFGNAVWSKTFGGAGDQVPVAVKQIATGEILICGTSTIGGFSSVFLIKTDKNGELLN
jgi:hypothetical protein